MDLNNLLEKVFSGNIKVLNYEYKDAEYSIQFEPKTVFYGEYWIWSLNYKEWEDTFYVNARNEDDLEFFKCTDGRVMEVELK